MSGQHVGFANLPNQIHQHAVESGSEFTIMIVGESGLGKSTFINTLFNAEIYVDAEYPKPGERMLPQTVKVNRSTVNLEENGVALRLTLVDTPGYGSQINNDSCWAAIVEDVNKAYETYMDEESRINRSSTGVLDGRVHCCLYFISPTSRGLKALDIEFLKKIDHKVNIIPVLAKADTMTDEECADMKAKVMADIASHGIEIFQFPTPDDDDDDDDVTVDPQSLLPFAVCASQSTIEANGKRVLGREYPWGRVEVENTAHCDFKRLRDLVIRTHVQQLIDHTHYVLYERYRQGRLGDMAPASSTPDGGEDSLLARFEQQRLHHEKKMSRMEQEMTNVFEMKVKEKEHKLKESEARLSAKHADLRRSLDTQKRELERKREEFLREKEAKLSSFVAAQSMKKKSNRLF